MNCFNGNGGNKYNFADLVQYFGQLLSTTGDTITLIGQAIALENDRQQQISDQKDKDQQSLEQQQTQQQIAEMQAQIKQLQKQMENRA
ncbi:hypothetical protein [Sporolactobacillus laevolacticus]|uniref:Uncharacterized protein n=1 Tax=Sporolactobacillus laevolacticus DSM 442 TaxID=1395513 RepID=V6IXX6_9BACL|nr:hypothetical protein [Sporolactobacillus laevolacticus]EST12180.1 hypothetical protein P343_07605 [Sporolactobacillus laevolacticus DSM 442]